MAKAGSVKVLHRATDGDDAHDSSNGPCSDEELLRQLQASNDSLKQRLEQTKASAAAERKRLADELRLEKAGRQRAEELLVRQAKELETCAAAKARLEEAFSRSMSELRYTRLEHQQAEQTIQQLLRELMQLREITGKLQQAAAAGSSGGSSAAAAGTSRFAVASAQGGIYGSSGGVEASGSSSPVSKTRSKGKLIGELQQLRAAMAAAESKLGALEAEKERAEECQEMISRQTAKLLDDRAALLSDINSKDDAVRALQSGLDHLQHQLTIALSDRSLLLQQLRTLAGDAAAPEMDALSAALATGFSQDLDAVATAAVADHHGDGEQEKGAGGLEDCVLDAGEHAISLQHSNAGGGAGAEGDSSSCSTGDEQPLLES